MASHQSLKESFMNKNLDYYFDDNVKYGKRQTLIKNYGDKTKLLMYGSLLQESDLQFLSKNLPLQFSLGKYLDLVYDQNSDDSATSCSIAHAINIRTNFINADRYTIVRWIAG